MVPHIFVIIGVGKGVLRHWHQIIAWMDADWSFVIAQWHIHQNSQWIYKESKLSFETGH